MLLSAASRRDKPAADADASERLRTVRDRLEVTASGLGELEFLRQRQEELVRAALELREDEEERQRTARVSSGEKLLEENILLLRKQLNCLRRRDAGLITQLQELDRQISDLQLDTEASHDHLEPDSRPSSGFYELSDGASGSLSNSSVSVFSECFCSMADIDGRLRSADELASCLDCDGLVGGLCEDLSSGTVHRSLSAPHPPTLDPYDFQSKYHCDLVARHGSDVYCFPSPLHAVAVKSPGLLQMLFHGGHSRDEGVEPSPVSAPVVPQSTSWPTPSPQMPSHKRLDSYIYSLVQRRALSVRTSRPRTSILRQASLCVRQGSGPSSGSGLGTLRGSELKPSRPTESAATTSPQRQWTVEQENQNVLPDGSIYVRQHGSKTNDADSAPNQSSSSLTIRDVNPSPNSLLKKKRHLPSSLSTATLFRELGGPKANTSPPDQKVLFKPTPPESSPDPPQTGPTEKGDRSVQEVDSLCSSSQSQEEAAGEGGSHMRNTKRIPAQQKNIKLCKGSSKTVKTVKVKTTTSMKMSRVSEHNQLSSERRGNKSHHRSGSKRSQVLEEGLTRSRGSKTAAAGGGPRGVSSSRLKCQPVSIPEGRVLDKHTASRYHHRGNHHTREQVVVVAKPKYKRNDYRRLRAIMELPCDEAFRRTRRRQRTELVSHSAPNKHHPSTGPLSSPYANTAGSDSEYSAECASLFHSTIVETSEDERSNYTTNCFGDSESSEEDHFVEETTTASDTEESGGGGAGWAGGGAS